MELVRSGRSAAGAITYGWRGVRREEVTCCVTGVTLQGISGDVLALTLSSDGHTLYYSGSDDKLIKAWRLNEGGGQACVLVLVLAPKKRDSQVAPSFSQHVLAALR